MDKMRILLPLFKGMDIKPNLRRLVMSQVGLQAYENGETMRVVKGTRIKEISEEQLREEIRVYSEAGVDDKLSAKMRAVRSKYLSGG